MHHVIYLIYEVNCPAGFQATTGEQNQFAQIWKVETKVAVGREETGPWGARASSPFSSPSSQPCASPLTSRPQAHHMCSCRPAEAVTTQKGRLHTDCPSTAVHSSHWQPDLPAPQNPRKLQPIHLRKACAIILGGLTSDFYLSLQPFPPDPCFPGSLLPKFGQASF